MKLSKNTANHLSTVMGAIVAISTAWMTIDWTNFNIQKEWPKLVLSAVIAIGGYVTSLRTKQQ